MKQKAGSLLKTKIMTTIEVMTKKQELLKAMRLLAANVISQDEYNDIQQSYMDCYLVYVQY